MNATIKYIRVEGNKLIIVPTKDGIELLKARAEFKDGEDTLGKHKVFALVLECPSPINFLKTELRVDTNTHYVYIYDGVKRLEFQIPAFKP